MNRRLALSLLFALAVFLVPQIGCNALSDGEIRIVVNPHEPGVPGPYLVETFTHGASEIQTELATSLVPGIVSDALFLRQPGYNAAVRGIRSIPVVAAQLPAPSEATHVHQASWSGEFSPGLFSQSWQLDSATEYPVARQSPLFLTSPPISEGVVIPPVWSALWLCQQEDANELKICQPWNVAVERGDVECYRNPVEPMAVEECKRYMPWVSWRARSALPRCIAVAPPRPGPDNFGPAPIPVVCVPWATSQPTEVYEFGRTAEMIE